MEKAKLPLYYIADELEEMQKKEQQTGNEKDQKDDNKPKVEPIILDSPAIEEETPKDGKSVQTTGVFLIGIAIILAVFEFFFELDTGVINFGLVMSASATLISGSIFYCAGRILCWLSKYGRKE